MKRFYKKAESGTAPGGYVIRLDGKTLKTPLQHAMILASKDLADAAAAEWEAQDAEILPLSMPFNQLINVMIDKTSGADFEAMKADLLRFAGSDLLCYFADHPQDLVKRQESSWRPILNWLEEEHGIKLETVHGIRYQNQPETALSAFKKKIHDLDNAGFTVVQAATALTGSVVMAFALKDGFLSPEQAYEAACVDEIYQLEKWGEDMIARKRIDNIRHELAVICRFRDLVTASP